MESHILAINVHNVYAVCACVFACVPTYMSLKAIQAGYNDEERIGMVLRKGKTRFLIKTT